MLSKKPVLIQGGQALTGAHRRKLVWRRTNNVRAGVAAEPFGGQDLLGASGDGLILSSIKYRTSASSAC